MEFSERTLQARDIADAFRLTDVAWDRAGEHLVWSEGRSGRTTLVSWSVRGRFRRDLVREPDVQARVGYGGGEFTVGQDRIYYVAGRRLYSQKLAPTEPTLVAEAAFNLSSPTLSADGRWLLLVAGTEDHDRLLLVPSEGGSPIELYAEDDFLMQPCWHPSDDRIAWISWNHPFMPWQQTRLRVADLDLATRQPALSAVRQVESGNSRPCSWFQPAFSPDGARLAVVNDASGWSNLAIYRNSDLELEHRIEDEAEYAPPAWVQGLRSFCWSDDDHLVLLRNRQGLMSCLQYSLSTRNRDALEKELGGYTWFSQPTAAPNGAVGMIGASAQHPPCVLSIRQGHVEVVQRAIQEGPSLHSFSKPRPIKWEAGKHTCHGLYYAPLEGTAAGRPPAVIKIHGGPTSQAQADFDFDVQFFTTRGFGVLKLNYRGSSGYGCAYREALDGAWGEADVKDTGLAARVLTEHLGADPQRIVLSGGSAGGFTLLLALIRFPDRFRAAVCRFPVTDLLALSTDTHKFERHYVDSLIGPLPDATEIYRARSPLSNVDQIRVPLALFQGDSDKVVPRDQSDRLADSLKTRGIPHLYTVFPGEGHGWRKSETIEEYYSQVERFLEQHGGI
ncbi:MAG: LpqB family beta-propeller domain-containing protein [Acidobacteriota bacterium]